MTGRTEVERRVDELAEAHRGKAFADAVAAYHTTLDEHGRVVLGEVLLERAGTFDQALIDRVDARGWLRRQWDRAGGR